MTNAAPTPEELSQGYIEFCAKVDALVAKFNEVADQELAREIPDPANPQNLEELEKINAAFPEQLKASLLRISLPSKIEALKEIFGKIADLGMEAVQEGVLGSLPADAAIDRLNYVLDVMNDDDLEFAVRLVRTDAIICDEAWVDVRAHRDDVSNQLRAQIPGLYAYLPQP